MEWHSNSELTFAVNPMLPFERRCSNAASNNAFSASAAVYHCSLGIHFDGARQDLAAEKHVSLVSGQRFKIKLGGFLDIGHSFFEGVALRLAPLEFRAPGVKAMLVFLDKDRCFASHAISVALFRKLNGYSKISQPALSRTPSASCPARQDQSLYSEWPEPTRIATTAATTPRRDSGRNMPATLSTKSPLAVKSLPGRA